MNDTLRNKWGYDGYISSDSDAIEQAYKGHNYTANMSQAVYEGLEATCDIDSGHGHYYHTGSDYGTGSPYTDNVVGLVTSGVMPEEWVDKALYDAFRIRFELGLFDQPVADQTWFNIPPDIVNNQKHKDLNLFAARSVMTLLKNDNNMLPLDPKDEKHKMYAVIGPHYNATGDLLIVGGYTGQICREFNDFSCAASVMGELEKYIPSKNLLYAEGCDVLCNSTAGFANAIAVAQSADIIFLMMGLNQQVEREGIDRSNISLPGYQQNLAAQICNLGMLMFPF